MRQTTWILFIIIAAMTASLCWGQSGRRGEQSRGGPDLGVARVSVPSDYMRPGVPFRALGGESGEKGEAP